MGSRTQEDDAAPPPSTMDALTEQLRTTALTQPLSPSSSDLRTLLRSFSGDVGPKATLRHPSRTDLGTSYAYLARLVLQPTESSLSSAPESGTAGSPAKQDHIQSIAHILGNEYLNSTGFTDLSVAFAFLSAILQVDIGAFASLVQLQGIEEKLYDAADLVTDGHPKVQELAEGSDENDAEAESPYNACTRTFVNLVATAAGYSATRPLARKMVTLSPSSNRWFLSMSTLASSPVKPKSSLDDPRATDTNARVSFNLEVTAAAIVAFIKLQVPDTSTPASMGSVPTDPSTSTTRLDAPSDAHLYETLTEILALIGAPASPDPFSHVRNLAIEGLALLSLKPSTRRAITKDTPLLSSILFDRTKSDTKAEKGGEQGQLQNDTLFSLATLLVHLTAYHRVVGEEEKAKEKLRRYASLQTANPSTSASSKEGNEKEVDEDEDDIDRRLTALLERGVMQTVLLFVKSSSNLIRQLAATVLLNLVDKRERRGLVIQQGGARMLLVIIKQNDQISKAMHSSSKTSASSSQPPLAKETFVPIQALARLLITANPLLVLGPTKDSPLLIDSIHPLALPLLYPEQSSLLQKFESLMALTNVASLDESLQERISRCGTFPNKEGSSSSDDAGSSLLARIEELILDCGGGGVSSPRNNTDGLDDIGDDSSPDGSVLCRRAATELLCNLMSCETAFVRFSGITSIEELETVSETEVHGMPPSRVMTRLHILVALSDVEDLQTRLAALAVLATLTMAPKVCAFLASATSPAPPSSSPSSGQREQEQPDTDRKFTILVSAAQGKEPGIQLRAIECLKNIALHVRGRRKEVVRALGFVARLGSDEDVKDSAKEALESLSHL